VKRNGVERWEKRSGGESKAGGRGSEVEGMLSGTLSRFPKIESEDNIPDLDRSGRTVPSRKGLERSI